MVYVIDNHDSFTYNLVQMLLKTGFAVEVFKNDEIEIADLRDRAMEIEAFVISPGPGRPADAGISRAVVQEFHLTKPILGVCLGHQVLAEFFGAEVVNAKRVLHGRTSEVEHMAEGLYRGVPSPFTVMRYHSLIVTESSLPACLEKTAWSRAPDGEMEVMGFRHRELPLAGLQFHPESVLTEHGELLLLNFLSAGSLSYR